MEIALAITGLILTGVQVGSALHDFISINASNAPTIAQAMDDEINEFTQILSRVQAIMLRSISGIDIPGASLIDLNHLSSTLVASVHTFSELERELDRVKCNGKMDLWNRFRWARAEKTFLFIIQRLQSHKSTFSTIVTILTSASSAETKEALERLAKQVGSISTSLGNNTSGSDNSQSIHNPSQTESTNNMSIRSAQSLPQRSFESALQLTRPYRRVRYSDSIYSKDSRQSYIGRWSLYSADSNHAIFNVPISLCEPSGITLADKDIGARLLPIAADGIYNHTRYQVGEGGPSVGSPSVFMRMKKGTAGDKASPRFRPRFPRGRTESTHPCLPERRGELELFTETLKLGRKRPENAPPSSLRDIPHNAPLREGPVPQRLLLPVIEEATIRSRNHSPERARTTPWVSRETVPQDPDFSFLAETIWLTKERTNPENE
ncbi:hypothetical protein DFP73DRAFT_63882 [Morchella snyderi]|nr:hypothetical protein DFP73DRAFT_63882 [Morchella snyderi]